MAEVPDDVRIETVFLVEVPYTPEAPIRRPLHRYEHLSRLAALTRAGRIIESGGCADWSKAVLLIRATDEAEVLALIDVDVYTLNGVWHDPTVRAFGRVAVDPEVGAA